MSHGETSALSWSVAANSSISEAPHFLSVWDLPPKAPSAWTLGLQGQSQDERGQTCSKFLRNPVSQPRRDMPLVGGGTEERGAGQQLQFG